jgi:exopolysaccharide production protein ExoZ
MIVSIQIFRGIASLLVAISHLPLGFNFGFFGVDIFFVISGFVMAYTTRDGRQTAANFLVRRGVRVLPLYWIITSISLIKILHDYRHSPIMDLPIRLITASYFLVPLATGDDKMDFYPIVNPGWSLEYEAFFYLCFSAAIWFAPRRHALVIGISLCMLCGIGAIVELPTPLFYYARTNTLEFVYGMGIARLFVSDFRMSHLVAFPLLVCAAAAAWVFAPHSDEWDSLRGFGWGLPAAAIVTAAVLSPAITRNWFSRVLEALGDASYSLYLTHEFTYQAISTLYPNLFTKGAASVWTSGTMLACALALGFIVYAVVERPLTRALQGITSNRSSTVPAVLPRPQ